MAIPVVLHAHRWYWPFYRSVIVLQQNYMTDGSITVNLLNNCSTITQKQMQRPLQVIIVREKDTTFCGFFNDRDNLLQVASGFPLTPERPFLRPKNTSKTWQFWLIYGKILDPDVSGSRSYILFCAPNGNTGWHGMRVFRDTYMYMTNSDTGLELYSDKNVTTQLACPKECKHAHLFVWNVCINVSITWTLYSPGFTSLSRFVNPLCYNSKWQRQDQISNPTFVKDPSRFFINLHHFIYSTCKPKIYLVILLSVSCTV